MNTIEQLGLQFPQGYVHVKIIRSMLDGKMSGILSGAGGAHRQLCTVSIKDLKDIEMLRAGFPINRYFSDAWELFGYVDKDEYLSLTSSERLGITHEPISEISIMAASPLHSYTCVFRLYMLLIYHLQAGRSIWSPTSKHTEISRRFCSEFLFEKGLINIRVMVEQTTESVARQCFLNKNNFIFHASTLIPAKLELSWVSFKIISRQILRIYNSSHGIDTEKLETLAKETHEIILTTFPWASITPLHKLLAQCVELIQDCNNGYGLKEYSEEGLSLANSTIQRASLPKKFIHI